MKILKSKTIYHEYALENDYDNEVISYCKFLKETFGWREFQWDSIEHVWRFRDPMLISMIKEKFEETDLDEVKNDLKKYLINKEEEKERFNNSIRIKTAITTDFKPNGIKGELYEYQKIGIEFLLNSGGRALLADSPGVGKTAQYIGYAVHSGFKRNLVVCPASVKFSWSSEIWKWAKKKSFIVGPQTKISDIPFDVEFVIINFDILKKFHDEFKKYKWNSFVVDECQLIKNPAAIRSQVVKSIAQDIPSVIFLTGTPVLSRPAEMFNMLNIIDGRVWNNYFAYASKYCAGHQGYWGYEAKGATNLDELSEKISKYFLRRTKKEVLKELPPKNLITILMELPREERKQYDLVEESLVDYMKSYKKDKTNKDIAKSMNAEKLVKLNLLREISTMAKLPIAMEIIDSIIESGEKVLVFSSFNAPLEELEEHYKNKSVMITGKTNVNDRGDIVNDFQNNPEVKVFLGGMLSAGTGITLTAASNVVFLNYPWNPADLEQSQNRAHRPGADYESLNIYQIVGLDTIDGFMEKLLKKKQEIIDQLIEEKDVKKINKSMVDDYLKELKLKYKK